MILSLWAPGSARVVPTSITSTERAPTDTAHIPQHLLQIERTNFEKHVVCSLFDHSEPDSRYRLADEKADYFISNLRLDEYSLT